MNSVALPSSDAQRWRPTYCTRLSRETTLTGNASQRTPPLTQLLQFGRALSHFCLRWRQRVQARSDRSRTEASSSLSLTAFVFSSELRLVAGMVGVKTALSGDRR